MFPAKKNAKLPQMKKVSAKKKKSVATTRALMAPTVKAQMSKMC
jgi:hypothetical protein